MSEPAFNIFFHQSWHNKPTMIPSLSLASLQLLLASSAAAQTVTQIWNFTTVVSPEGSALLPNGEFLFSTEESGNIYVIDPSAANPVARSVGVLPGATNCLGIAKISDVKYGIIGHASDAAGNNINATLYTVEFPNANYSSSATIGIAATLPTAKFLNGAAPLPADPSIVFLSDSELAAIWRVDTKTGSAEIVLEDDAFAVPTNNTVGVPVGINGLKIRAGYAYFSNSAKALFGRAAISEEGVFVQDGGVEVIYTAPDAGSAAHYNDLFVLDDAGTTLVTDFPDSIVTIYTNGTAVETLVDALMLEPSSIQVEDDGTWVMTTHGGLTESGQVVKVTW